MFPLRSRKLTRHGAKVRTSAPKRALKVVRMKCSTSSRSSSSSGWMRNVGESGFGPAFCAAQSRGYEWTWLNLGFQCAGSRCFRRNVRPGHERKL